MRRVTRYDPTLTEKIIKEYRSGRSQTEICKEYGIPKSTFYNWLGKFSETGSIDADRIAKLKQENLQLKILLANNILTLFAERCPERRESDAKE